MTTRIDDNLGDLKKVTITTPTLPAAWFETIEACVSQGRTYAVTEGSYAGQQRKELDYLTVHITHPHDLPLLPVMPPGMEELNPVPEGMEYIEKYLPYLMTDRVKPNEAYTYGQRLFGRQFPPECTSINCQVDEVIAKYKRGFGNNQCSMTVAIPTDVHLEDPPCLRHIDTRIFTDEQREGPPKLHFFVYFRSWDLYNGFPANLAAIEHLQSYMAHSIGVEPGEMIATSKGVHIYDHAWKLAQTRIGESGMKKCQRCESYRVFSFTSKSSDLNFSTFEGRECRGYFPHTVNVGRGDYVEADICLECGQAQGKWPVKDPKFEGASCE